MRQEPQALGLRLELGPVRARPGDEEPHVPDAADHARERLERELEALLVHQPPGQKDQPLVGRGVRGAQRREVRGGPQVERVDPVGDDRTRSAASPRTSATWPRM
jgi:hypothetical protein